MNLSNMAIAYYKQDSAAISKIFPILERCTVYNDIYTNNEISNSTLKWSVNHIKLIFHWLFNKFNDFCEQYNELDEENTNDDPHKKYYIFIYFTCIFGKFWLLPATDQSQYIAPVVHLNITQATNFIMA